MSDLNSPKFGDITWADLTVKDADSIKNFYQNVVGWHSEKVNMGGYDDFNMVTSEGHQSVAGICHARGVNASLPAQWLIYVNVSDIEKSVERCIELGGEIISELKGMGGYGRYCVIKDPAGAVVALFEPTS